MTRYVVSAFGLISAFGFIAASAFSNWLFAQTLASNEGEMYLYRALSLLTVGVNATAPFFIAYHRKARNRIAMGGAAFLFMLSLCFSFSSAFGLAAYSRQAKGDQIEAKADIRAELASLYSRKKSPQVTQRIDELNRKLETKGENDAQTTFIAKITKQDHSTVRITLALLYATLVEVGAAFLPYISLAHLQTKVAHGTQTTGETNGTTDRPGIRTDPGRKQAQGLYVRPAPSTTAGTRPGNPKPPIPGTRTLSRESPAASIKPRLIPPANRRRGTNAKGEKE